MDPQGSYNARVRPKRTRQIPSRAQQYFESPARKKTPRTGPRPDSLTSTAVTRSAAGEIIDKPPRKKRKGKTRGSSAAETVRPATPDSSDNKNTNKQSRKKGKGKSTGQESILDYALEDLTTDKDKVDWYRAAILDLKGWDLRELYLSLEQLEAVYVVARNPSDQSIDFGPSLKLLLQASGSSAKTDTIDHQSTSQLNLEPNEIPAQDSTHSSPGPKLLYPPTEVDSHATPLDEGTTTQFEQWNPPTDVSANREVGENVPQASYRRNPEEPGSERPLRFAVTPVPQPKRPLFQIYRPATTDSNRTRSYYVTSQPAVVDFEPPHRAAASSKGATRPIHTGPIKPLPLLPNTGPLSNRGHARTSPAVSESWSTADRQLGLDAESLSEVQENSDDTSGNIQRKEDDMDTDAEVNTDADDENNEDNDNDQQARAYLQRTAWSRYETMRQRAQLRRFGDSRPLVAYLAERILVRAITQNGYADLVAACTEPDEEGDVQAGTLFDKWVLEEWPIVNRQLRPDSPEAPLYEEYRSFARRIFTQLRNAIKSKIFAAVLVCYHLLPGLIDPSDVTKTVSNLLDEAFHSPNLRYPDKYQFFHPIIAVSIRCAHFDRAGRSIGFHYPQEFGPIPLPTIALHTTIIHHIISRFTDGNQNARSLDADDQIQYFDHFLQALKDAADGQYKNRMSTLVNTMYEFCRWESSKKPTTIGTQGRVYESDSDEGYVSPLVQRQVVITDPKNIRRSSDTQQPKAGTSRSGETRYESPLVGRSSGRYVKRRVIQKKANSHSNNGNTDGDDNSDVAETDED